MQMFKEINENEWYKELPTKEDLDDEIFNESLYWENDYFDWLYEEEDE